MSRRQAVISLCMAATRLLIGIDNSFALATKGECSKISPAPGGAFSPQFADKSIIAGCFVALLTASRPARKPRPGERVAQMVEHLTFNQVVVGSSPTALTTRSKVWGLSLGARDSHLPPGKAEAMALNRKATESIVWLRDKAA
jgi:hypothetical protein